MKDILEGLYNTDDEKGKQKAAWCSFFFYLFLLLSFVISIVASVKCTKVRFKRLLREYRTILIKLSLLTSSPCSLKRWISLQVFLCLWIGGDMCRGVQDLEFTVTLPSLRALSWRV